MDTRILLGAALVGLLTAIRPVIAERPLEVDNEWDFTGDPSLSFFPDSQLSYTRILASPIKYRFDENDEYYNTKIYVTTDLGNPGDRMHVNMEYYLSYNEKSKDGWNACRLASESERWTNITLADNTDLCMADVFTSPNHPDTYRELQYCQSHKLYWNQSHDEVHGQDMEFCLPYQQYVVKLDVLIEGTSLQQANLTTHMCTQQSRPRRPPISTQTAYRISKSTQPDEETVTLYWLPMPKISYAGENFRYFIQCELYHPNKLKFSETFLSQTWYTVSKSVKSYLNCELFSENNRNKSFDYSPINVPASHWRLKPDERIRLVVFRNVAGDVYEFIWTPLEIIYETFINDRRIVANQINLFWCKRGLGNDCSDNYEGIEVIPPREGNTFKLEKPRLKVYPDLWFGISFIANYSVVSTGIIYEKTTLCKQEDRKRPDGRPLEVTGNTSLPDEEFSAAIHWSFDPCDLTIFEIANYTINYCHAPIYCGAFWPLQRFDPKSHVMEEWSQLCVTEVLTNVYQTKFQIPDARGHVGYFIRARYQLENGTVVSWSKTVPIGERVCTVQWVFLIVNVLFILTVILVLYCKTHVCYRRTNLLSQRYRFVRGRLNNALDFSYLPGIEMTELKWYIDHPPPGEVVLSPEELTAYVKSRAGYRITSEKDDPTMAYVPLEFMEARSRLAEQKAAELAAAGPSATSSSGGPVAPAGPPVAGPSGEQSAGPLAGPSAGPSAGLSADLSTQSSVQPPAGQPAENPVEPSAEPSSEPPAEPSAHPVTEPSAETPDQPPAPPSVERPIDLPALVGPASPTPVGQTTPVCVSPDGSSVNSETHFLPHAPAQAESTTKSARKGSQS